MRRLLALWLCGALFAMLSPANPAAAGPSTPARTAAPIELRETSSVHSIYTSEFGVNRPAGLTYSPDRGALYTVNARVDDQLNLVGVTPIEDPAGETLAQVPESSTTASTLAYDPVGAEFTALTGDTLLSIAPDGAVEQRNVSSLGLQAPEGAAFDRAGRWYVLDAASRSIVHVSSATDPNPTVVTVPIRGLAGVALQGLAFNRADSLLYTMDPAAHILYGIDKAGRIRRAYDLSAKVRDPGAMVFAPSADATDPTGEQSLYLADGGSDQVLGSVLEVSLAPIIAAAITQNASLVRTSNLANLNPPSPDPAGITYIPEQNRLMISDSEVEEMGIYQNVNLYKTTLTGTLSDTGRTTAFSNEPTGTGYQVSNQTLYISDDDADQISLDKPGADGRWGTNDDQVTEFSNRSFGNTDGEGCDFDNVTGHLFIIDGLNNEVYDVDPGPNGRIDGVGSGKDDSVTHFDVGQYGANDPEGIAIDEVHNTIFVLDHKSDAIYEFTKNATLLRTIGIGAANAINPAGLTLAPASGGAGTNFYIVDRGLDNDSNPSENDGKMYEMSFGASVDNPPTVTVTAPTSGQTISGTFTLQATANDDIGVDRVQFRVDGTLVGTDTAPAGGWTLPWDTTTVTNAPHTIQARAFDTANQTANHSVTATVDNDASPTVNITAPAADSTVSGAAVPVTATANDDFGVTQVEFKVGATVIGTDTTPGDGFSATWNTTGFAEGAQTITATAKDASNQTGTHSVGVTVDNVDDPPTVQITNPAGGAKVRGSINVTANANDDHGVTQVEFKTGATSIGIDSSSAGGWSVPWNTTAEANGPHTLTAIVSTTTVETVTSAPVAVTVDNDLPTVGITNPTGGSVQGTIPIEANASDATTSVAQVRFFVGATLIGTDTDPAGGWSIQWNTTTVANGARNLTAEATDAAGNQNTSAPVAVTVNNPVAAVINVPVAAASDDAEQQASGAVDLGSSDLELVADGSSNNQTVGIRFAGVNVPVDATITNAYIQFQADEVKTGGASMTIRGQDSDTAATFTTLANSISSRPQTTESAPWNPQGWPTIGARGPDQRTSELKDIVQEIVDRTGWNPNQAMAMILTGTGVRTAEAFESGAAIAAALHIEYFVDNDASPTVNITAPAADSTVSGAAVPVTATANDDFGVTQVEFKVGATVIGTDTTPGDGFSATWNTTGFAEGAQTITATAKDASNQTGTHSVGVTVDNVDDPPTVQITNPAGGAKVRGSINVTANANDDHGVTQVEFKTGATSIGIDSSSAGGWSVPWNTTAEANGPHTLTAIVSTTTVETVTSAPVAVTVDNDLPTVGITNPTGGSVQGTIPIEANASDATTSVAQVRFFVGATLIGTDTDPAGGWSIQWNTTTVANGARNLTAEATDAAGNQNTSAPVAVTVNNPVAAVINVPVAAASDDAEQQASGAVDLGSSDLELVADGSSNNQTVGIRFAGVNVPVDATITNAYIQFQADEVKTGGASMTIRGQDSDTAATFTTLANSISSRPQTTESAPWNPQGWPTIGARGPDQRTSELKDIVQEIVDRTGWNPNQAMAMILTGTGVRTAEAFESGAAIAAALHIEYVVP